MKITLWWDAKWIKCNHSCTSYIMTYISRISDTFYINKMFFDPGSVISGALFYVCPLACVSETNFSSNLTHAKVQPSCLVCVILHRGTFSWLGSKIVNLTKVTLNDLSPNMMFLLRFCTAWITVMENLLLDHHWLTYNEIVL